MWESLHNPAFKRVEFDGFRNQAGLNAFTMSPTKWIEGVDAILIEQEKPQSERLILLRKLAVQQLQTLASISLDSLPKYSGEEQ